MTAIARARLVAYAADAAKHRAGFPWPAVVCPSCTCGWPVEYLASSDDILTEGHIVPRTLGGRQSVLECASCNHRHGGRGDAAVVLKEREADFLQGNRSLDIIATIGGKKLPCSWRLVGDTNELVVIGQAVEPEYANSVLEPLVAGSAGTFSIRTRIPSRAVVLLGYLHIAHLRMFHAFGYEYRFSKAGCLCVSILSERLWPEDVAAFTVKFPVVGSIGLGDLMILRSGRMVAFAVCTLRGVSESEATLIPNLDTGEATDLLLALQEREHESLNMTVSLIRDVGYFADQSLERRPWLAHRFLEAAGCRRS